MIPRHKLIVPTRIFGPFYIANSITQGYFEIMLILRRINVTLSIGQRWYVQRNKENNHLGWLYYSWTKPDFYRLSLYYGLIVLDFGVNPGWLVALMDIDRKG